MFKYLLYKFGQFIVNRTSLAAAYRFAVFFSDLQYYFSFRDRRAVENNLRVIFPSDKNVSAVARDIFRNFGKYLVDFFRMRQQLNQEYIKQNVKVRNIDRIQEVLQKGKGAIFVTAHIGNWELGAAVMSLLGYPMMAIALPHKERPVNDLFNAQREKWGITIVPPSIAVRKCLETLHANKIVALVADRDFTANGEVMDFLGRQALIPKGAALFSLKTGAPIIPTFFIREPDDTYTFSVEEPIEPPVISNPEKNNIDKNVLLALMAKYKSKIEEKIRQYPSQWMMFREFWV